MTDIRPHVKVIQHPNPTRRSFHVTRHVTEGGSDWCGFGDNHFSLDKKKPGQLVRLLTEHLQAIPGVTSASFKPYEIFVGIGEAFDWRSIGPIVLGEIVNTLFPDALGKTIEITANVGVVYYVRPGGWSIDDDGHRVRYQDTVKRKIVDVDNPLTIDVERFLNPDYVPLVVESEVILQD